MQGTTDHVQLAAAGLEWRATYIAAMEWIIAHEMAEDAREWSVEERFLFLMRWYPMTWQDFRSTAR